MKQLDTMIDEFTKSTKSGFSAYVKQLEEIRGEFDSLETKIIGLHDNHIELMKIKNSLIEYLSNDIKLEQSRTWWNKLWGSYPNKY